MKSPAKIPVFLVLSLAALPFGGASRAIVSAQTDVAETKLEDDFGSNAFLALPPYRPIDSLKGTIRIAGSNTVGDVAAIWKARFEKYYPEIKIELASQGTATGIAALKAGKVDIATASTRITKESLPQANQLVVCTDMLGIYVAKDNPVEALTVAQLKALFGKPSVKTWMFTVNEERGATVSVAPRSFFCCRRSKARSPRPWLMKPTVRTANLPDKVQPQ